MPLNVANATEADIPEIIRIDNAAYKGSMGESLFFPNQRSPEILDLQEKHVLKEAREDPSVRNVKVIDTDHNDKPIAFARWHLYYGDKLRYLNAHPSQKAAEPGADPAGLAMWEDIVRKKRIEYIGKTSHCYLSNLTTHPEDQGRGAGTILTRWGCEVADDHGVPTYVQSSPAGRQTYEKCGFEEAYAADLDLTKIGLDGVYRTWLMVRYPRTRSESNKSASLVSRPPLNPD